MATAIRLIRMATLTYYHNSMWFKIHKKPRPGQPLSAQTLREYAQTLDQLCRMRADPPLEIVWGGGGPLFRLAGMLFGAYVGVTDGTITARVGLTPGTGNVTLYTWNGTALASLGIDKPIQSPISVGLPGGLGVIILRVAGSYWIIWTDAVSYWCVPSAISGGTLPPSGAPGGPATGQTIYTRSGATYTAIPGTYSVYDCYVSAVTSSKMLAVRPNFDGTFDGVAQSCT
jgi:hypothetical protein